MRRRERRKERKEREEREERRKGKRRLGQSDRGEFLCSFKLFK